MSSDEYDFPLGPTHASPRVCKVCGSETSVMYLGIQCCSSCKMFFRRHTDFDLNTHQCVFQGDCNVTVLSRGACRYCRLKKCLSVGLDRDLIRASHPHREEDKKRQKRPTTISNEEASSRLPVILPTLDLLLNDRSLLSTTQWSLLSSVTHAYDEKFPTLAIRDTIAHQLTYPSKMRIKMAAAYFQDIARSLYLSAGPFVKTMPQFIDMSLRDKGILVERNISSMSGFGAILVMRETNICDNPYYCNASIANYGRPFTDQAMKIVARTDTDGTLIKLMVPILALSTCSDVLEPDDPNDLGGTTMPGGIRLLSDTLGLFRAQNVYVEILFKYMLYRYGYPEASLRFASLIKSCIEQNLLVAGDGDLKNYHQMVQAITDQTERSLTLNDERPE